MNQIPLGRPRRNPTIGFIGLGRMGGSMAGRLLAAGYQVYGMSRTRDRALSLLSRGMHWLGKPRTVAEAGDLVFTSLPDDGALQAVADGPDGLLAGLSNGKIWIDMSTVSPPTSRRLATQVSARGGSMLDAPVSGTVPDAQDGTLAIMVGGDENAYAMAEPVLCELGTPIRVGVNGQGLVLKLALRDALSGPRLAGPFAR